MQWDYDAPKGSLRELASAADHFVGGNLEDCGRGRRRAHLTKLMDTNEYIKTERGAAAVRAEFANMLANNVWDPAPVAHQDIEDNALVVSGKMLISEKNWEMNPGDRVCKGRFVAQGCILLNKDGTRFQDPEDYWAPTATLAGARLVTAHAVAQGRIPQTIDLKAAYLQAELRDERPYYLKINPKVIEILPDAMRNAYTQIPKPLVRLRRALYGLPRSGHDFIMTFREHLTSVGWAPIEGDIALLYKNFGDQAKSVAICATYVDDVIMSVAPKHAKTAWSEIAQGFTFDAPKNATKFLGMELKPKLLAIKDKPESFTSVHLSQSDYAPHLIKNWEQNEGSTARPRLTAGPLGGDAN